MAPTPPAPLPVHLQELLELLEAQTEPNRLKAIREIEARHPGVRIELDEALEHDEFAARYGRWMGRLDMALEDEALTAGLSGRASASAIARARGVLGAPRRACDSDNGRVTLGRPSRARAESNRRRW